MPKSESARSRGGGIRTHDNEWKPEPRPRAAWMPSRADVNNLVRAPLRTAGIAPRCHLNFHETRDNLVLGLRRRTKPPKRSGPSRTHGIVETPQSLTESQC